MTPVVQLRDVPDPINKKEPWVKPKYKKGKKNIHSMHFKYF